MCTDTHYVRAFLKICLSSNFPTIFTKRQKFYGKNLGFLLHVVQHVRNPCFQFWFKKSKPLCDLRNKITGMLNFIYVEEKALKTCMVNFGVSPLPLSLPRSRSRPPPPKKNNKGLSVQLAKEERFYALFESLL